MSSQDLKKIFVVCGATGSQGGSVINALLENPSFNLRALTRDPSKPRARALVEKGVEVVRCNMHDRAEVQRAFEGAWGVFAVTNFWDPEVYEKDPGLEEKTGKMLADVAKEKGVQRYIWSSLDDPAEISHGKFKNILHFSGKYKVEKHIRALGLNATFVYLGFYMSNFRDMLPPVRLASNVVEFRYPCSQSTMLPLVDTTHDTGIVVAAILDEKNAKKVAEPRNVVRIAGGYYTMNDIASSFAKVTGENARFVEISSKEAKEKQHMDEEMIEMFEYFEKCGYYGGADISSTQKMISGKLRSWEEWLRETGWKGPKAEMEE